MIYKIKKEFQLPNTNIIIEKGDKIQIIKEAEYGSRYLADIITRLILGDSDTALNQLKYLEKQPLKSYLIGLSGNDFDIVYEELYKKLLIVFDDYLV